MNQRTKLRRGLWSAGVGILACLLAGSPAANATFTSSTTVTMTASSHVMAAPTGNTVSTGCSPIGNSGKHRLTISVNNHGSVPRATNYVLKVTDPSGSVRATIDLAPDGTFQDGAAKGGWWTYSIEAQYRVPGSTNVWMSNGPQASVYC